MQRTEKETLGSLLRMFFFFEANTVGHGAFQGSA